MRATEFVFEEVPQQPAAPAPSPTDGVKNSIIQKIQNISDPAELNKIYSYVRKLDIGTGYEDIFTKDKDLRQVQRVLSQAIVEAPGTFEEKLAFAKELVTGDGIISLEKLFTPGIRQSLISLVNTKHPEIYEAVAPDLLNIAGAYQAGTKKTQRGKGEFFLALLSPKITLSKEEGDLNVNGKLVEVKGNLARIKGRHGYGTTDGALKKIRTNLNDFLVDNTNNIKWNAEWNVNLGAKSNFWNGEFGDLCMNQGADAGTVDKFLKKQLELLVKSLYLKISPADLKDMTNCIDSGRLNFSLFHMINKRVAFEYYQESDKFAGILCIHPEKLECIWCPDSKTFQSSIGVKQFGFAKGQQNGLQIKF